MSEAQTHPAAPLRDVVLFGDYAERTRVATVGAAEQINAALARLGHPPVTTDLAGILLYRAEAFGGYLLRFGLLLEAGKTAAALDLLTEALARVKEHDQVLWSHKIPSREEFFVIARRAALGDARRCHHLAAEYGASGDGMRQVLALRRRGIKVFEGD